MNTNSNAVEADQTFLKKQVDEQIDREGSMSSFMIRAGLLRDILARASITNTTTEDGDICDGCATAYRSVFRVPNEVWSQIAPKPDSLAEYIEHQYGGLLCLNCADNAALKAGITLVWEARLNWGDTTEDGLAGDLTALVEAREYEKSLSKHDHPDAFAVSLAGENRVNRAIANLAPRIITALSPSPSGDVVEALTNWIVGGLEAFGGNEPDFTMSFGMRKAAAEHILGRPWPTSLTTPQHTTSPDALLRDAAEQLDGDTETFTQLLDGSLLLDGEGKPELRAAIKNCERVVKHIDQHLQGAKP